jgi:hypothetical protein
LSFERQVDGLLAASNRRTASAFSAFDSGNPSIIADIVMKSAPAYIRTTHGVRYKPEYKRSPVVL